MPFIVQNRPAYEFAPWAALPGMETIPVVKHTGDFNGDGTTDLALVNTYQGWNTVPVALSILDALAIQNRPVGDFAGWASTPGVSSFAGDFNADGRTDLALVNEAEGWSTVPVALSGAGDFTTQNRPVGDFAAWARTSGVTPYTGDFNGDGTTDLALVNRMPGWSTVPVALSDGSGFTIQNRPAADFASWATGQNVFVLTGDFNNDDATDLALINNDPGWNTVPVALGGPDGFTIQNRPVGEFAAWAAAPAVFPFAGDFNGDGATDVALVNRDAGWTTVPVALSDADGFTIQNRPVGEFASWARTPGVWPYPGDYNGDGSTDLALVNHTPGWNTVPVALSDGSGFTIQNEPAPEFAAWAQTPGVGVYTGDYNNDDASDLALVNSFSGWITVPVALGFL